MGIGKLEYQMVYTFLFLLTAIKFDIETSHFKRYKFAVKYYENIIATKILYMLWL